MGAVGQGRSHLKRIPDEFYPRTNLTNAISSLARAKSLCLSEDPMTYTWWFRLYNSVKIFLPELSGSYNHHGASGELEVRFRRRPCDPSDEAKGPQPRGPRSCLACCWAPARAEPSSRIPSRSPTAWGAKGSRRKFHGASLALCYSRIPAQPAIRVLDGIGADAAQRESPFWLSPPSRQ